MYTNAKSKRLVKQLGSQSQIDDAKLGFQQKNAKMDPRGFAEMMKVKKELRRLKREIAAFSLEKMQAEREIEAAISKAMSLSTSAVALEKEIEEVNENQVLVELATMEALKECGEIISLRREEKRRFSSRIQSKKMVSERIDDTRKLEDLLTQTLRDVAIAKSATTLMGNVKAAKTHLASVSQERDNLLAEVEDLRKEMGDVKQESKRRAIAEEGDGGVEKLKARLSKEKGDLKALATSTEHAAAFASNLSRKLEQYIEEEEDAHQEMMMLAIETANVDHSIGRIEDGIKSKEETLAAAMGDLQEVKSMEAEAFERLQNLAESVMKGRESLPSGSSIKISEFEYEYLKRSAGSAKRIADLKVASAKAWVEALVVSRREMEMKIASVEGRIAEGRDERKKGVSWGDNIVMG